MMVKQKGTTHFFVAEDDDRDKELQFEIHFQLSLTDAERYAIMEKLVKDGLALIEERGRQDDTSVVVRS